MTQRYNFISGLPRSGTTLLTSILNQNPRFTSGISDPLLLYINSIIRDTSSHVGLDTIVDIDKQYEIIKGIFNNFYSSGNEVCFNTNRSWTSHSALLKQLYPDFKMIVCVRDVPFILNSFEILHSKNPFTIKPIYHYKQLNTVYDRTAILMSDIGIVYESMQCLKASMFCQELDNICYLEYETLINNPISSLQQIYDFLEEPWFDHDFNNVIGDDYTRYDDQAKLIGLHTIHKSVGHIDRARLLPDDLWAKYEPYSFWMYSDFNEKRSRLNWIK
jgi:sulfotransferase